ncbi:MAG: hypothetical protein J5779_01625, partial [Clostridia bacterium]|nr:hypothetical protein [Clostridia bacterium]
IRHGAFYDCKNLKTVIFNSGLIRQSSIIFPGSDLNIEILENAEILYISEGIWLSENSYVKQWGNLVESDKQGYDKYVSKKS